MRRRSTKCGKAFSPGKTDALEAGDHFRLASIIEVGITVGEVLCEMGWRFIYAPDGHRSSHPTIRW
jgi:hypothetical protein